MARAKSIIDIEKKDLIDLDTCVQRLQELWKMDRPPYSRRTLQNKLSRNEFKRYGPYHHPLVDWDEVREKELKGKTG